MCMTWCDVCMNCVVFFFLMIRRPPRSTLDRSSAASDVYKRQGRKDSRTERQEDEGHGEEGHQPGQAVDQDGANGLSLIHISEPTRPY